ncbi:hypothetical protein [uncultured Draconibacterium sp.]|uniref:hypothetical protein n=1 Tax=uncultured Draconibacterium sp. TaxID=1573823 RepID=UPI0025F38A01|nr:hypothetical protein [uncultured Draconibacterium sp.]
MKKIGIALLLILSVQITYSQVENKDYFKFNTDTIDLSSNEKVLNQKEFILNCMDYILDNKSSHISIAHSNCFKIILKLNENKDYNVYNLDADPLELIKGGNMAYQVVYWAGLTKLRLENPQLIENDSLLALASIELFVDYYSKPENNVHLSKERKLVANLKTENELGEYIHNLIIETTLRRSKQKPTKELPQKELVDKYRERLEKIPDSLGYELFYYRYANGNLKMLAIGKKVKVEKSIAIAYLDSALFFHKNSIPKVISYVDSIGRPTGWKKFNKQGELIEIADFEIYNTELKAPEFLIKYFENGKQTKEATYVYYTSKKKKLIRETVHGDE